MLFAKTQGPGEGGQLETYPVEKRRMLREDLIGAMSDVRAAAAFGDAERHVRGIGPHRLVSRYLLVRLRVTLRVTLSRRFAAASEHELGKKSGGC